MMASMATRCDIRQGAEGVGTEVRLAFDTPGSRAGVGIGVGDDRFELLLAVERIADQAGWPGEGPDQLVALIVPRIADACTIDIVGEDGEPQRLAARYEGPGGPELAAHLASRRPTREQFELTVAELRAGRPRVVSIDTESLGAIAHDDEEARRLDTMDLAHWVNLPLQVSDQLLGASGSGCRRRARRPTRSSRSCRRWPTAPRAASPTRSSSPSCSARASGSSGSSARSPRPSPSTTSAARSSTPTRRPRGCSAPPRSRRCWPPSRASSRLAS